MRRPAYECVVTMPHDPPAHAGDFFGFGAFEEYGIAAEALTDLVVIRYPRQRTDAVAWADGAVNRCIREIACRSLTASFERLLNLGRKTKTERVVTFMLELARAARDGRTVSLPMSRSDIGDYLGLTLHTVSRTLAARKHDGLIEMTGVHRLVLLDRVTLDEITASDEPAV